MTTSMFNAKLLPTAPSAAVVVVRVVVVRSGRRACGGGRRQCAVGTGTTHDSKTPPAQTGRGFSFKLLPESRPRRKGLEHGKFGHNIDA